MPGKGVSPHIYDIIILLQPSDIDYVDGVSQGPIPSTPEGSRAGTSTVCNGDHEEMVFSGGAWREVILKDLEEGIIYSDARHMNTALCFSR